MARTPSLLPGRRLDNQHGSPQPAAGRGASAGAPLPSGSDPGDPATIANLHRVVWIEDANREDDQLYRAVYEPDPVDAIRRKLIERSRLERIISTAAIWLCVAIVGYFAAQYLRAVFTAGHAFGGLIGGVS